MIVVLCIYFWQYIYKVYTFTVETQDLSEYVFLTDTGLPECAWI